MNTPYGYALGARGAVETLPQIGRRVKVAGGGCGTVQSTGCGANEIVVLMDNGDHKYPCYGSRSWEYTESAG